MFRLSNFNRIRFFATGRLAMKSSRSISSAGCLIIGDEVLNGKILDTNSYTFAKFCFDELAIPLKRTIVCGDDKEDIKKSVRNLIEQDKCDFIVTSGGIGPTHDDITYESLAEAFDIPCELDEEVVERMNRLRGDYVQLLSTKQRESFYRMATLPQSSKTSKIFTDDSLWVPVVGVQDQVYVLPGVPQLFTRLLNELRPFIEPRITRNEQTRYFVKTSSKESELAPFLTDLQEKCNDRYGINNLKLGSYPHMSWGVNTISIIGTEDVSNASLREVVDEVMHNVGGDAVEINKAEENKLSTESPNK